jgi:phage baseplate assembly protein W
MSYSLMISNGDLVLQGSALGIVWGTDKLKQDLTLWMTERYGVDRFHPNMGSNFQNYIGGIISYSTQSIVYSEAMRILDNYQRVQMAALKANPTLFSLDELLWNIDNVNVGVGYDQVNVAVDVSNAVQQQARVGIAQGV